MVDDLTAKRARTAAAMRRHYACHPEVHKARARRWQKAHPDRWRQIQRSKEHRRRARAQRTATCTDRVAYGAFDRAVRAAARIRCYWCGRTVRPEDRTLDHIIPISRGGADDVLNLCCACRDCNSSKAAKLPHEFDGQYVIDFGKTVVRQLPTTFELDASQIAGVRLTKHQREVFYQRFTLRKSVRDVALSLGICKSAVKRTLTRIRRRVQATTSPH